MIQHEVMWSDYTCVIEAFHTTEVFLRPPYLTLLPGIFSTGLLSHRMFGFEYLVVGANAAADL